MMFHGRAVKFQSAALMCSRTAVLFSSIGVVFHGLGALFRKTLLLELRVRANLQSASTLDDLISLRSEHQAPFPL